MAKPIRKKATKRKISKDELNAIADSFYVQKAEDAVKYKLADKLMYKDEILLKI